VSVELSGDIGAAVCGISAAYRARLPCLAVTTERVIKARLHRRLLCRHFGRSQVDLVSIHKVLINAAAVRFISLSPSML
jgi:hypothetical protein